MFVKIFTFVRAGIYDYFHYFVRNYAVSLLIYTESTLENAVVFYPSMTKKPSYIRNILGNNANSDLFGCSI